QWLLHKLSNHLLSPTRVDRLSVLQKEKKNDTQVDDRGFDRACRSHPQICFHQFSSKLVQKGVKTGRLPEQDLLNSSNAVSATNQFYCSDFGRFFGLIQLFVCLAILLPQEQA